MVGPHAQNDLCSKEEMGTLKSIEKVRIFYGSKNVRNSSGHIEKREAIIFKGDLNFESVIFPDTWGKIP